MSESQASSDALHFFRDLCEPVLAAALERALLEPDNHAIVAVLRTCREIHHNELIVVIQELNGVCEHPAVLASLFSEVRQYDCPRYQSIVAKEVFVNGEPCGYGEALARWLQMYSGWARAIT